MKKSKKIGKVIFSSIIILVVFASGVFAGGRYFSKYFVPSDVKNASLGADNSIDFSLFWQAWNKAKSMYIGGTDNQKMLDGAISGMVSSLGDQYSVYLNASENKKFSSDLSGNFEGIGAELTMKNNLITVVAPLSGSPAEKAGLKANDIITEIDGTTTEDMAVDTAVDKIRGDKGTTVKLKIYRSGQENQIEISIVRDTITIESVTYNLEVSNGKKIANIKINQFGDDTLDLFEKAAAKATSDDAVGVILDLRNNPGGYLDTSVEIASFFLGDDKVVVSEKDKKGKIKEYKTNHAPVLKDIPTVVLVNEGSASAAEIVTGALKDYKRADIIGTKTFGKGSVQALESLTGGAALKITIAKWLTPLGTEIDKKGIMPDIEVNNDSKAQMDKALEVINNKIK